PQGVVVSLEVRVLDYPGLHPLERRAERSRRRMPVEIARGDVVGQQVVVHLGPIQQACAPEQSVEATGFFQERGVLRVGGYERVDLLPLFSGKVAVAPDHVGEVLHYRGALTLSP